MSEFQSIMIAIGVLVGVNIFQLVMMVLIVVSIAKHDNHFVDKLEEVAKLLRGGRKNPL